MKVFKKILIAAMLVFFATSIIACSGTGGDKPNSNGGGGGGGTPTGDEVKAPDIKKLADLTNYGSKQAYYEKGRVDFSADNKTYAGTSCAEQMTKLQMRIGQKEKDVRKGDSTSSFVKIFAKSTPEGILDKMAKAALSYEEMNRVVEYLYGSKEDPDIGQYLEETAGGWLGFFSDGKTKWLEKKNADNTAAFNDGWSFFDDWEMYDRLKKYAEDARKGAEKDLAGDNAAWQYRSILAKVYEEVKLDGDAAARTATYLLEYAVEIVENQSGGSAEDAIHVSGGNTTFNNFADYCKNAPSAGDPFSGLHDYETLSYLLAFNEYYNKTEGLKNCVTLYGYYYDYNKTYYFESLQDEATYTKQLKYEKQKTYTDEEWLDYVSIQRNNYVKAYRYSENCYTSFYEYHFGFQSVIEDYDARVYEISRIIGEIKSTVPGTTYTSEMKSAIEKTGSINGLAGQLALSDWMWCYSASETRMKAYNAANTQYEDGKESGNSELENEGKFNFEMQQLYIVKYLLTYMTKAELNSALYYNVYAYSASMVNNMTEDIKKIVYIKDDVEDGSYYTSISSDVTAGSEDVYAREKIKVIYDQTYTEWSGAGIKYLTEKPRNDGISWEKMKTEIQAAIDYDYENMSVKSKNTQWLERAERLEDLVIVRVWSCCGQKVSEADPAKCPTGHVENSDGTVATKDYATDHTISQFVSEYEVVLMYIGGQSKISFQKGSKGYRLDENVEKTWTPGYNGTIADLRATISSTKGGINLSQNMTWDEVNTISVSTGSTLFDQLDGEVNSEDYKWWNANKVNGVNVQMDSHDGEESYSAGKINFSYTYTFKGWYLDKDCKYEFDENDSVGVNLTVYAGYTVTKTRTRK